MNDLNTESCENKRFKTFYGKPTYRRYDIVGDNLYDNKTQQMLSEEDAPELTRKEAKKLRDEAFKLSVIARDLKGHEKCEILDKMSEIDDKVYLRDFYKFRKIGL